MAKDEPFLERRRALEEEFFRKKDAELVAKYKNVFDRNMAREEIALLTGVKDEEVLDRLVRLHVNGQIIAAFHFYPLIEVAWADGGIDKKEREAVMAAVLERGIKQGEPAYEFLERGFAQGPNLEARKAWYAYAEALRKTLPREELDAFRAELLEHARAVARASGGILNVAFTTSPGEKKVLRAIQDALTP